METGAGSGAGRPVSAAALWRALRPHQWAKNLLVFVPLALTPERAADAAPWITLLWAFAALCAVASSGYLANDLVDVESDRADPERRRRPFASGALAPSLGVVAGLGLAGLGFGLALAATPPAFALHLAIYFALTLAYSFQLKRHLLLDVLVLAGLYTLRLLAGGAAVGIALTPWLLAFSMFLFLGLAFAKRYVELRRAAEQPGGASHARAYRLEDLDVVLTLGATSTYLSVLVLCLYINSEGVDRQYLREELLWLLAPLLLYWSSRIWFLARRGELSGDPVAFAVRDPVSLATGALMVLALAFAIG